MVPYGPDLLEYAAGERSRLVDPKTVQHSCWCVPLFETDGRSAAPGSDGSGLSPSPSYRQCWTAAARPTCPCRTVMLCFTTAHKDSGLPLQATGRSTMPDLCSASPVSTGRGTADLSMAAWIGGAWRGPGLSGDPGPAQAAHERPHSRSRAGRGAGVESIPCQSWRSTSSETMTPLCSRTLW